MQGQGNAPTGFPPVSVNVIQKESGCCCRCSKTTCGILCMLVGVGWLVGGFFAFFTLGIIAGISNTVLATVYMVLIYVYVLKKPKQPPTVMPEYGYAPVPQPYQMAGGGGANGNMGYAPVPQPYQVPGGYGANGNMGYAASGAQPGAQFMMSQFNTSIC